MGLWIVFHKWPFCKSYLSNWINWKVNRVWKPWMQKFGGEEATLLTLRTRDNWTWQPNGGTVFPLKYFFSGNGVKMWPRMHLTQRGTSRALGLGVRWHGCSSLGQLPVAIVARPSYSMKLNVTQRDAMQFEDKEMQRRKKLNLIIWQGGSTAKGNTKIQIQRMHWPQQIFKLAVCKHFDHFL